MNFQIHRYPAPNKRVDLVLVADYSQDDATAIESAGAWNQICIPQIYESKSFFFDTFTIKSITFRKLIKPGILIEEFAPDYADKFQEKFQSHYAVQAHEKLLPIITNYRRRMHREHEMQRDDFMNVTEPLQLSYQPYVTIILHDRQGTPTSR
jgi:hypothetical protein